MLNLGSHKIYLCTGCTDMRKSINGLCLLAQPLLDKQSWEGAIFVFRGKNANRIKILWWSGTGFCLLYKRLETGRFIWQNPCDNGVMNITRVQLNILMDGADWRKVRRLEQPLNPPKYAG